MSDTNPSDTNSPRAYREWVNGGGQPMRSTPEPITASTVRERELCTKRWIQAVREVGPVLRKLRKGQKLSNYEGVLLLTILTDTVYLIRQ